MTSTIVYTILCTASAVISLQWAAWPLLTNWHQARAYDTAATARYRTMTGMNLDRTERAARARAAVDQLEVAGRG